ncbi:hypothetical protein SY83_09550 [Paenibacillus swuensis]|uniref:Putative NAD(P)H nitroreductase n=1 Tax=Paenibacillus swuensis TaxID=1178515 RepID=A0A172THJ0_9BACL|nr:nitroreductase [Paenibacillus swuensis]ANE46480.1 hypothetical protein SY83_09550 [Paenibacillus swuensis]
MSIAEVIRERRSIRDFKPDSIDEATVLSLLEDAVWAPFHSKNEPWRFIFVSKPGKERFIQMVADSYLRMDQYKSMPPEQRSQLGAKLKAAFHAVPAFLLVIMKESESRKRWEEDFAATSALIQNFMLLAWEQGVGTVWKTNPYIYDRLFCDNMCLQSDEKIVGVVQLGYPAELPEARERVSASQLFTVL